MKRILILLTILSGAALFGARPAAAQHTVGFTFGSGMGTGRFEPQQETRPVWGIFTGGLSWRYYTAQRVVGCIGADLEFLQRAFSMATNASRVDDPKDYLYYTRRVNSIVLPIVWQPHAYLARRRLRLYGEAGVTFSYNLSSEWEREYFVDGRVETEKGDYTMRTVRDNRWGYGLVGGGGAAVLVGRFEINLRARYYFGYSDILRNRNKYSGTIDGFTATPLRSPLDNLTVSVGLNYRLGKEGFEAWKPRRKREKNREVFEFAK